jgi:hypothetical protein
MIIEDYRRVGRLKHYTVALTLLCLTDNTEKNVSVGVSARNEDDAVIKAIESVHLEGYHGHVEIKFHHGLQEESPLEPDF